MSGSDPDLDGSTHAPPGPTGWVGDPLRAWFAANRGQFTDEALVAAAIAAGHSEDAVRTALERVVDAEVSAPVRVRARKLITWLYLGGYVVLVGGMLIGQGTSVGLGPGPAIPVIGTVILTFILGLAFVVSRAWLGRRVRATAAAGALPMLLSVPVVLWLGVSGLCVYTGLPFGFLRTLIR